MKKVLVAWFALLVTQSAPATPAKERPQTYHGRSRLGEVGGTGLLYCDPGQSASCKTLLMAEGRIYTVLNERSVRGVVGQNDAVRVDFLGEIVQTSIFGRDQIKLAKVEKTGLGERPQTYVSAGTLPASTQPHLKK